MINQIFSGSYAQDDVAFLLNRMSMDHTMDDLEEKERLIQSGASHYSEMISREQLPSDAYFDLYESSLARSAQRVAADLASMVHQMVNRRGSGLVLVSLARAGTPFGVLARRQLRHFYSIDAPHYSVSIIRDRGIDANALRFILNRHPGAEIVFIDGWTGKGAIMQELRRTIADFNLRHGTVIAAELYTLVDLAGIATAAGSLDDYLIPSAILNAPISGLISRSILNDSIGPGHWHGCLYYEEWKGIDRSRSYVEAIIKHGVAPHVGLLETIDPEARQVRRVEMQEFISGMLAEHSVTNSNLIKPGIGEATRAVLRRSPERVYLSSRDDPDVEHLALLCEERSVSVEIRQGMPVKAAARIRSLGDV